MGAPCDSCPTCGGPAGPATPQQEVEHRLNSSSSAVKSLTTCFEALDVKSSSSDKDAGAAEASSPLAQRLVHQRSDSSDDDIKLPTTRQHNEAHRHEPILEDNDERFCLLPVK